MLEKAAKAGKNGGNLIPQQGEKQTGRKKGVFKAKHHATGNCDKTIGNS